MIHRTNAEFFCKQESQKQNVKLRSCTSLCVLHVLCMRSSIVVRSGSKLLISGGGFGRLLKRLAQHRGLPVDDPVHHAEGSIAAADLRAKVQTWFQKLLRLRT